MSKKIKPFVSIIGRPNVGKSTLINRLKGGRIAIVNDEPGVTRDRQYIDCEWGKHEFVAIDTGGIIFDEKDSLLVAVQKQIQIALDESDCIIFLVDAKAGTNVMDEEIGLMLKKQTKPVVLAVNKVDNLSNTAAAVTAEFYSYGFDNLFPVSSLHGTGIGELLDAVFEKLSFIDIKEAEEDDDDIVKLAIVGKPNVGKSSIINTIIGEERMIVHHVAGTTRDSIDTPFEYQGNKFILIDTAGMRRKSKVSDGTEYYSVNRSLKSIKRANVVAVVIDCNETISDQDLRVIHLAVEEGKAVFIIANKKDLLDVKDTKEVHTKELHRRLGSYNFAPVIYTSTVTKKNLFEIFALASMCLEENQRRIQTGLLNKAMQEITGVNPPPSSGGRHMKIYYSTQVSVSPPNFVLFVNDPDLVNKSYLRYVEQKLRDYFGFSGTPIKLNPRISQGDTKKQG